VGHAPPTLLILITGGGRVKGRKVPTTSNHHSVGQVCSQPISRTDTKQPADLPHAVFPPDMVGG
jgi:hypothetical protein